MGLSAIGPVMQIAFVPEDFNAALQHWSKKVGVGPFYLIENIALKEMIYRGKPSHLIFSIALAYWGDIQIELIRKDNDAPSIYDGCAGQGLHHTCILTDDIARARQTAERAGCEILVEANVGEDGGVIYVDSGGGPGTIVEILQPASGGRDFFAMIKAASVGWDGTDPLRKLG